MLKELTEKKTKWIPNIENKTGEPETKRDNMLRLAIDYLTQIQKK